MNNAIQSDVINNSVVIIVRIEATPRTQNFLGSSLQTILGSRHFKLAIYRLQPSFSSFVYKKY